MRDKLDITWLAIGTLLLAAYAFLRFPDAVLSQITWQGKFVSSSKIQAIGLPIILSLLGVLGYQKYGKRKYFYLALIAFVVLLITVMINHYIL